MGSTMDKESASRLYEVTIFTFSYHVLLMYVNMMIVEWFLVQ